LKAQYREELDSLREEVARLISLLEQALTSKSEETKFSAQPDSILANPQNLGVNKVSFESQMATYSQFSQPTYPIKTSSTIDFIVKECQKDKMVKEDGLEKLVALEQSMRAFEGTSLHDHIKAVEMCLVPNVIISKNFRVFEFVKYIRTQCSITHLNAYCNKMVEVVYDKKLLIHFFQDYLSDAAFT